MKPVSPSSHELWFAEKPKYYKQQKAEKDRHLVEIHGTQIVVLLFYDIADSGSRVVGTFCNSLALFFIKMIVARLAFLAFVHITG